MRSLFVGVGSLLTIAPLRNGPPVVTDDPEPPSPGGWEINVPFIIERTPGRTVLFTGGRDIVGDTRAIAYIELQLLTN